MDELTSKVVMARLHAWPATLTKWNNYDPFIQEGLKPERPDTGRHGPGRQWKHIYSPDKIALHEQKAAEVLKGCFVTLKEVEIDRRTIPAGTKFISPETVAEKFMEIIPSDNPKHRLAWIRQLRHRGCVFLGGEKPRGYRFGFRYPDPKALWWVEADIDAIVQGVATQLRKHPRKPGPKAKKKRYIPRAIEVFNGSFDPSKSNSDIHKVPEIVAILNDRLRKYKSKITSDRLYHWLEAPEKLPQYLHDEFPDGLGGKRRNMPGFGGDDFDKTMTAQNVKTLSDAIVLVIKSAESRKHKTAKEICDLEGVQGPAARADVIHWLGKNLPKRDIWIKGPRGFPNFLKVRGYDPKEVQHKLAGRSIVELAKEQWVTDLGDAVLAAVTTDWTTTADIASRITESNSSRTYSVLKAICAAGQVEVDPPLPWQHGANLSRVRWRKPVSPAPNAIEQPAEQNEQETFSGPKKPFIPSSFQRRILAALDGRAMTADRLQSLLKCDRKNLYRDGLNPLKKAGFIINDRSVGGYLRPDRPPPEIAEFFGKN